MENNSNSGEMCNGQQRKRTNTIDKRIKGDANTTTTVNVSSLRRLCTIRSVLIKDADGRWPKQLENGR
jgi:hypothetical protein